MVNKTRRGSIRGLLYSGLLVFGTAYFLNEGSKQAQERTVESFQKEIFRSIQVQEMREDVFLDRDTLPHYLSQAPRELKDGGLDRLFSQVAMIKVVEESSKNVMNYGSGFFTDSKDGKMLLTAGHLFKGETGEEKLTEEGLEKKVNAYLSTQNYTPWAQLSIKQIDMGKDVALLQHKNYQNFPSDVQNLGNSDRLRGDELLYMVAVNIKNRGDQNSSGIIQIVPVKMNGFRTSSDGKREIVYSGITKRGFSGSPLFAISRYGVMEVVGVHIGSLRDLSNPSTEYATIGYATAINDVKKSFATYLKK